MTFSDDEIGVVLPRELKRATQNTKTQQPILVNPHENLKNHQWHNHNLSVIDIIEELIKLAKDFDEQGKRGESLGLTEAESVFYDAPSKNDSAKKLMGDKQLIKLAKNITDKLRKSASIEWQYKDAVKAKMRILVRCTLMMYRYPPNAQPAAIQCVLEQADEIAERL